MKKLMQYLIVVCMGMLAAACAQKTIPAPFTPVDLNAKVASGEYVKKVDNFIVLFDASSSMYLDRNWESKLEKAKLVATNMNNTIPTLELKSGMRIFGPKKFCTDEGCPLHYGLADYSKAEFGKAIDEITSTSGLTPMAPAVHLSKSDLTPATGDIAVIVIGDGLGNVGGPVPAAAKALKEQYGDRVCIYTILIGDDPEGRATMEAVAATGGCGFSTDEEAVASPAGMASFVEKVFLKKAEKCTPPAICPPPPAAQQCFTVELKVEFDFDKSFIRPQYYKTLTEFADFMRSYPDHKVNLEGHTDWVGTDQYNMGLAQRRATSVRNFLLENFKFDPTRLTAIPYGESKPIASNDTKEGRQRNRRVFATFTYCKR